MAMRKQHVSFDTSPYKVITISVDTAREDEATMQNSTKFFLIVFSYSFLIPRLRAPPGSSASVR